MIGFTAAYLTVSQVCLVWEKYVSFTDMKSFCDAAVRNLHEITVRLSTEGVLLWDATMKDHQCWCDEHKMWWRAWQYHAWGV